MAHDDVDAGAHSNRHLHSDGIGPTVDLADVALPPAVGERLGTLYGTDDPPRTALAWMEATRAAMADGIGRVPTVEDLCRIADGDHVFDPAGPGASQAYVCVLDPLAYPFLTDTPGTIRSTTQVREETITIDVGDGGVDVSHPDGVVSIGVTAHVDAAADLTPEHVYRQVCGYIHVFADVAEYETWASEVDAATTHVPVETGIGIAKALTDVLFDGTGT